MKNERASKMSVLAFGLFIAGFSIFSIATDTNTGKYYDMSNAATLTVNVDNLEIKNEVMYFGGIEVEIDPQMNAFELVHTKEEINLRVADNRISIIVGDNGEF